MPHCKIEYSDNIADKPDWQILMKEIHKALDQTGLFNVNDIKSRVVKHDDYLIGDGDPKRAFVTLNLQILSGRDKETKVRISESLLKIMDAFFPLSKSDQKLSLTVQISELDRDCYRKVVNYD